MFMYLKLSHLSALVTLTALLLTVRVSAQGLDQTKPQIARPKITGISHVGFFVSDLPKALKFWHDFLGYEEYFELKRPGTDDVRIAFLRINDRQHVELFTDRPTSPPNYLSHLCFTVDNIEQMKAYLKSKGVTVPEGKTGKTKAGDLAFEIRDPESLPTGVEAETAGKFDPETRISSQIYHAGFLVGNSQKSLEFYEGVLGFRETWRGASDPKMLSWINLQVPEGKDYIELMLYSQLPATFGTQNHLSLAVPDIAKAVESLKARAVGAGYVKPLDVRVGRNGKRQVNLYDADGTRVELMEPFTADGKPVAPSQAPPPSPVHP
jgi:lactoylglutathione lyase